MILKSHWSLSLFGNRPKKFDVHLFLALMSKFAIKIHYPLRIVLLGRPWDIHWTSIGHPLDIPPSLTTLVPLSCPVQLSSPTVQWTSMGHPLDIHWTFHPHRPGFTCFSPEGTCGLGMRLQNNFHIASVTHLTW